MDLTQSIKSAENNFKQILEDFFISVCNDKFLPSHGIDHHRRVWNYSKELLALLPPKNSVQISKLAPGLIIASYLHDIGMSVDPGIRHGKHSKDLCIRFLVRNNLLQNEFHDVLEAIEYHDNKDYTGNSSRNALLTILSVADDLDAFGFTGIFRYSEIYLTRGIDPAKIGYQISENSAKRFDNFVKTFGSESEIVKKYRSRYDILNNFFARYNEQAPSYHFGSKNPSGFCGVADLFVFMIKNKIGLEEMFLNSKNYMVDPVIRWFFSELKKELIFIRIH